MIPPANQQQTSISQARALLDQNQPQAAAVILAKALAQQPQNHTVRNALAFAQARAGQALQAIDTLRQGLLGSPDDAELRYNLAVMLSGTGQLPEAIGIYNSLLKAQPGQAHLLNQLAGCHMGLKQFSRARDALEKSLEIDPGQLETWLILGQIHLGFSDTGQAQAAFEHAIETQPDDLRAYRQLAQLHEHSGRLEAALLVIQRGLHGAPDDGALLALQGRCLRLKGDHQGAMESLNRIQFEVVDDLVATSCHHELARIYHHQGQTEAAWRQFELSGQRALQQAHGSGIKGEVFFELEKRWDAVPPVRSTAASSALRTPVFVAGFPRSGTTLLDQFLSGHPSIRTMEEQPFLNDLVTRRKAGEKQLPNELQQLTSTDCEALRTRYWDPARQLLAGADDALIIDRTPVNFIHLPLIVKLWPNSRIIFILRHPLDVCLSCFMQHFQINSLTVNFTGINSTVALYQVMMQRWVSYRDSYSQNIIELRYEDLVADPETRLRHLINAIGLDWHPGVLDHQASADRRQRIRTASYQQVRQPVYQHAVNRWHRYQPQLLEAVETLRQLTIELGYADPREVTPSA